MASEAVGWTARKLPVRGLYVACALALFIALGVLWGELSESSRGAAPPPRGRLAVPSRGGLASLDTATGRLTELFVAPPGATVTASAWSPDRRQVAFALFHRRPEDRVSSGELFLISATGGKPRALVGRDVPGAILDNPAWSPDGSAIMYGYQGLHQGRPIVRLERVSVADGARQALYDGGSFPALAADGRQLIFVRDEPNGQSLALGDLGGGVATNLVRPDGFTAIMGPRFSPDGSLVAFTAVGAGPAAATTVDGLLGWLTVPVAEAHGDPWNVWTVRLDGSELRRVGWLQEDEPLVSWSPDGRWLAVFGTGGLWMLDPSGRSDPRRVAEGGFGAIDWAP